MARKPMRRRTSAPRARRSRRGVAPKTRRPHERALDLPPSIGTDDGDVPPVASRVPQPVYRRLRGYAFDPSLSVRLDTAVVNEVVYKTPWEPEGDVAKDEGLMPGPVGEYLEVVDYDPASGCFYEPVDLSLPDVLAQDGLAPSEGNPKFHQQMVYAVAMTTIRHFERALGRPVLWAPLTRDDPRAGFVRRLRVYPHAMREANAYYSPEKRALLFGYFPASTESPERYLPGGIVFTCLSHDIIAHETTHALLDGMHHRFIEPSGNDALAFHEAFADIVALFQRFTFPDVLRDQIARTRGDLASQNLLGELAQEFGEAIGNYGALRSAIGEIDEKTKQWRPHVPDPDEYRTVTEPHARGAILVAAVFDAFLAIYRKRVADLLRIATSGTGVLPEGSLHPDLVTRLANEAATTAQHVLLMCIRALDYCPPVDVDFGDYLRALVTADLDVVPDDDRGYRIAFIEAFRRRGIYPRDVRTLSVESLRWRDPPATAFFTPIAAELRKIANDFRYFASRERIYVETERIGGQLNGWIKGAKRAGLREFGAVAGIALEFERGVHGLRKSKHDASVPAFQISSFRPARRVGPDGDVLNQLLISMIQTRDVAMDGGAGRETFKFRGGCTLVLDLDTMQLQYAIKKDIRDEARLERQMQYRRSLNDGSLASLYFKQLTEHGVEPLAMLHRSFVEGRP